jgi:hypothetical protein
MLLFWVVTLVDSYADTHVSEKHTAAIFRVKNVGIYLQVCTTPELRTAASSFSAP